MQAFKGNLRQPGYQPCSGQCHPLSCQFLAQHTPPYTPLAPGRTALLAPLRQRMEGSAVAPAPPAAPPPAAARAWRPCLAEPPQALALEAPPRGGDPPPPAWTPEQARRGPTGSEPAPWLGVPLGRPPFAPPQRWGSLAPGRCAPGAAVLRLPEHRGRQGGPRGAQDGRGAPRAPEAGASPLARGQTGQGREQWAAR